MSVVAAGVLLILAAGTLAVALARWPGPADRAFSLVFGAGGALTAAPALAVLAGAPPSELRFESGIPGGPWVFGVDALSAVFLLAIAGVGVACALYGVAYLRGERGARAVGLAHLYVALLVAALVMVVTARAAVPFLIAWESMAIAAYVLIVFHHQHAEIRRAGLLYLVATHAGTLALFALFAVWGAGATDLTFSALAERAPLLPRDGGVVLALGLVGFGVKAGIVPLHFWLPEAHAAAPSHVSALMSGIVIKMGIYGLLRVLTLLGSAPAWFGWILLVLGAVSGLLGVLWALAQHDIKRLLAFHSVENIGIILLGMGAGSLGLAHGSSTLAVLGFAGAALHTLNHALFKSLLFLSAGSLTHGTGTREIDRLGGLARRMPLTGVAFLIGAAAIVGLPPLNGFLSEWLVFRALLHAGVGGGGERIAILGAAVLGLIGALALACFAKVVGIIFLGVPRDPAASAAHESPAGMVRPLLVVAGACVLIGLLPVLVLPPALRAGRLVAGVAGGVVAPDPAAPPATVFMLGLAAALVAGMLVTRRWPNRDQIAAQTWACGYAHPTPRMQYTASSFAAPLLALYRPVTGVRTHRSAGAFGTHAIDPVLERVLRPAWRGVRAAARWARPIQGGRLSLRLIYVQAAVIALLLYLLLEGRTP